ncbi:MAG: hypothetical protein J5I62_06305 [Flavobacteriales bacterium]|nr:hypothetical protein [Flavobacteriales bacterium]MEB2341720.1 hypothetical protein [Flavobacteriia bacterium]
MANEQDKSISAENRGGDAANEPGRGGGAQLRKWLLRAQAIVGVRTPGVGRRHGMSEAAERKARREMNADVPPVEAADEGSSEGTPEAGTDPGKAQS